MHTNVRTYICCFSLALLALLHFLDHLALVDIVEVEVVLPCRLPHSQLQLLFAHRILVRCQSTHIGIRGCCVLHTDILYIYIYPNTGKSTHMSYK